MRVHCRDYRFLHVGRCQRSVEGHNQRWLSITEWRYTGVQCAQPLIEQSITCLPHSKPIDREHSARWTILSASTPLRLTTVWWKDEMSAAVSLIMMTKVKLKKKDQSVRVKGRRRRERGKPQIVSLLPVRFQDEIEIVLSTMGQDSNLQLQTPAGRWVEGPNLNNSWGASQTHTHKLNGDACTFMASGCPAKHAFLLIYIAPNHYEVVP